MIPLCEIMIYSFVMVCVGRFLGRGALRCVLREKVVPLRTVVAIKQLNKEDKNLPSTFVENGFLQVLFIEQTLFPLWVFVLTWKRVFWVYKYVPWYSFFQNFPFSCYVTFWI